MPVRVIAPQKCTWRYGLGIALKPAMLLACNDLALVVSQVFFRAWMPRQLVFFNLYLDAFGARLLVVKNGAVLALLRKAVF